MRYLFGLLFLTGSLVSCSTNNVKEREGLRLLLEKEKVSGAIGVFHNLSGEFELSDRKWFRDSTALPGSSFAIINTLIGVETGLLKDGQSALEGITLSQAFRGDSTRFFQLLADSIGQKSMQKWIDSLGYGRRYDTPRVERLDQFWLDNSIKVTADEQLGLVKRLYFDQLPFQRRTHSIVSDLMLVSDSADRKLAYKTSLVQDPNGGQVLWLQGWMEIKKHPHFIVIELRTKDDQIQLQEVADRILKEVLAGFLP